MPASPPVPRHSGVQFPLKLCVIETVPGEHGAQQKPMLEDSPFGGLSWISCSLAEAYRFLVASFESGPQCLYDAAICCWGGNKESEIIRVSSNVMVVS